MHPEIRPLPILYQLPAEVIEPRFTKTDPKHPIGIACLLRAAKRGNDHLIDFLMSSSLADADPPPTQHDFVAFSTPMLAAIGQKNVKVIEVLLKQKGFNPTRQFRGMTYYEIAEKRRGPAWKDEVRILQQAYDDYDDYVARYWNYTSGQNDRSGVIPPANGADTTANVSVLQEPVHRNRAGI